MPAAAAPAPERAPVRPWDRIVEGFYSIPALWRDIGIATLLILLILGGLWGYTGQPFPSQPPLVVVESGSMMHPHEDTAYGKFGTIDPGDLILVKDIDSAADVVTMHGARAKGAHAQHPGAGDRDGYSAPGDVVIYRPEGCGKSSSTPIIHRAITWVEVRQGAGGSKMFSYHNERGEWVTRSAVDLPEMHLQDVDAFEWSGWITKGDNPVTNEQADQSRSSSICGDRLIKPEWLIGKARGEIPWIGLLKFIFQGNNVDPRSDWCTVGKAVSPCDTFTMLWVTLGVLILIPIGLDLVVRFRRGRDEDAFLERQQATTGPPETEAAEARERPAPERPRWAERDEDERP